MSVLDNNTENPVVLFRKRRNLQAGQQDDASRAALEEDDVPILTEVVLDEKQREAPASGEANVQVVFDGSLEELATQMTRAITEQMSYELPMLIEATLLTASEELRSGITSTMETALRNFITRHKPMPPRGV